MERGPVHAYWVAEKLGAGTIICPPSAGVASAGGFLLVPISFDFVRSLIARLDRFASDEISDLFNDMEMEGKMMMAEAGVLEEEISVARSCDMRYLGQGHEINVPIQTGKLDEAKLVELRNTFEARYKKIYYRLNPNLPVQCLSWRVTVSGKRPTVEIRVDHARAAPLKKAVKGERKIYSPEIDQYVRCPVYDRYLLSPGVKLEGPAVIEETESTIVVGNKGRIHVDENLCVIIKTINGTGIKEIADE